MSNKKDGMSLSSIIKTVMSSKGIDGKTIAKKRGVTTGTVSGQINSDSMSTKTLVDIFESMGEDVTLILKNGNQYTIKNGTN